MNCLDGYYGLLGIIITKVADNSFYVERELLEFMISEDALQLLALRGKYGSGRSIVLPKIKEITFS
jgi:hypothetical protein